MQVDTAQLRTAAKRLRAEVGNQLERSRQPDRGTDRDDTFDRYTGSAPYREAAAAWAGEIDVLLRATTELADALEKAADDYDRSDDRARARLTAGR